MSDLRNSRPKPWKQSYSMQTGKLDVKNQGDVPVTSFIVLVPLLLLKGEDLKIQHHLYYQKFLTCNDFACSMELAWQRYFHMTTQSRHCHLTMNKTTTHSQLGIKFQQTALAPIVAIAELFLYIKIKNRNHQKKKKKKQENWCLKIILIFLIFQLKHNAV